MQRLLPKSVRQADGCPQRELSVSFDHHLLCGAELQQDSLHLGWLWAGFDFREQGKFVCLLNKFEDTVRLENTTIQELEPSYLFDSKKVSFRTYLDSLLVYGAYDDVCADWNMF